MASSAAQGLSGFYEDVYYRVAPQQLSAERLNLELDLIVRALALPAGGRLLDVGCGYGRHAVPLAQRGYEVTGIDLSRASLRAARAAARTGTRVRFLRRDMRRIGLIDRFDGAVCMGAFGVLESDEEDLKALRAVRRALHRGGRFLLDHKSREWQVRHFQPTGRTELPDGALSEWKVEIDLAGGYRWDYEVFTEADGSKREYAVRERLYTLTELMKLLARAGLTVLEVWGDYNGASYGLDSPRVIVLSENGRA